MLPYENLSLETMDGEIWKPVVGYEMYYEISNFGRLKSLDRTFQFGKKNAQKVTYHSKIIDQYLNKRGYLIVGLSNSVNKKQTLKVHQLVAKAFIPNPENKPTVDHLNGVKHDNRLENLSWATYKEQGESTKRLGLVTRKLGKEHHHSKDVYEYDLKGNLIAIWGSIGEAARNSHISRAQISKVCNGIYEFCDNRVFSFGEKEPSYFEKDFKKLIGYKIPIVQKNLIGEKICVYPSAREAARQNNIPYEGIYQNLKKYTKTAYGFIWEYA